MSHKSIRWGSRCRTIVPIAAGCCGQWVIPMGYSTAVTRDITASLLASQSEKVEETLWVALRMFEERKNLLNNTAQEARAGLKQWYARRANEATIHIQRIRAMLLASQAIKSGKSH